MLMTTIPLPAVDACDRETVVAQAESLAAQVMRRAERSRRELSRPPPRIR